jgi:ribosomal protein S12 methylthiotransferase
VSLGCPKNLVDSEQMLGLLQQAGHEVVATPDAADVIVVNTCGFIDSAKRESIDAILEMAQHKATRPGVRLVVAGCLAQRYAPELVREVPEIDAVFGPGGVPRVVEAVEGRTGRARASAPATPSWLADCGVPRVRSTPQHLAYLKISEGCDYRCAFCVIPRLRGRYRSRTPRDILAEAKRLAAAGVRELVLIAQDTTRYGIDLGLRDGLARLLRRLARIDGLRWIRIMYAYPTTVTDALLETVAEEEKVVKYLDLPLQHASPAVLRRMRRPSSRTHVMGLVERIRRRVPGVALRSAFIVGFPGETKSEFSELLAFLGEARLDHVGVFTYSREEGTAAHALRNQPSSRTKAGRQRRLMEAQQRVAAARNAARLGERLEVLVDGRETGGAGRLVGRLASQAPEIDGCVLLTGEARPGSFVTCEITGAGPYDLVGRVVSRTRGR